MKHWNAVKLLLSMVFLISISMQMVPTAYASIDDQKVYDFYGLFTESEITDLEEFCSTYGAEAEIDIVIVTVASLDNQTRTSYLEDFYDQKGFGYDQEFGDTVLMLINMDPSDRGVQIQGYGMAEYYINNDRIEHMLDNIVPFLSDSKYYDAMIEYIKESSYYMQEEQGIKIEEATGDQYTGSGYGESSYNGDTNYYGEKDSIFSNTWLQLIISLVIGGVVVGIMASNSGGRVTVTNRTYLKEDTSGITEQRDDYLRTTTTRVLIPKDNNNNTTGRSSGGGGISSGGHSHSGGGRGF